MRVMVVGGAGYIGSHMCKMLVEHGHQVTVCDDLSTGHAKAVQWGRFVHCRSSNIDALGPILSQGQFDAVMHFAASSIVAESMTAPLKYYKNNVSETIALLALVNLHGINKFVFSSTAAVYGEPQQQLIDENHPKKPINPYGRSKLMVEQILADLADSHDLRVACLRYFNAAGADGSGLIGESHNPETHLIPRLLRMLAGEKIDVKLFGTDYPTPDGTCVRDYIHVNDLCLAHLRALEFLSQNTGFNAFNLGNGHGYSVREIISSTEEVVGRRIMLSEQPRRTGDPAYLVASSAKARAALSWSPRNKDVRTIIESAWMWHRDPKF